MEKSNGFYAVISTVSLIVTAFCGIYLKNYTAMYGYLEGAILSLLIIVERKIHERN